jgi:hypothetical protein
MATLLESIQRHIPRALHHSIWEYTDDSLEVFIEARDRLVRSAVVEHFLNFEDVNTEAIAWHAFKTARGRSKCSWGCLYRVYTRVKHQMTPICRCVDPQALCCEAETCDVCDFTQFIQRP